MNKQLLTVTLAATISGITFAETPNYDFMPIDFQQFCDQHNTQNCQEMAALFVAAQQLRNETGIIELSAEQKEQGDKLHAAIAQEIAASREIGIKEEETSNILTSETDEQKAEELVDQLNAQN